jgi:hypothetical protein
MGKDSSLAPSPEAVEHTETAANGDRKVDHAYAETEHQLTFRDVWKYHKAIIGWSFFWAMCAVGW